MDERREIENLYSDYRLEPYNEIISEGVFRRIHTAAQSLLTRLESQLSEYDSPDYSVYTGVSGIAFLFFFLSERVHTSYSDRAQVIIDTVLPRLTNRDITFLTGDAGPLALGAVLFGKYGDKRKSPALISKLTGPLLRVTQQFKLPDEVLYGKSGYLYSLLFINKYLGENTIPTVTIRQVVSAILCSGQELSRQEKFDVPLMYKWQDTYYLGAAHGLAGILFMLLQAKDYLEQSELETLIRPTIDYLQEARYSSANFRSSLESKKDKLVQWCHGAPGMVDLFCLAYKTFGAEAYLTTALQCGDIVWQRGLLKKGYSICHGVSGNAYTFISLFRLTHDLKHLYRAYQFADWCRDYGRHQGHYPDRPLSMFEGISGVIYFLFDILQPDEAAFPAYVL